jgi:hypothetical protein
MMVQTKHFIELSDIVALRFACKFCDVTMSLSLSNEKLKSGETQMDHFWDKCPNCHRDWLDINGAEYQQILTRATGSLNRLKELLYSETAAKLGVSFLLEIKPEAVPRTISPNP